MAAANRISGVALLAAAAVLTGALAPLLPLPAVLAVAIALGLFLTAALIRFGASRAATGAWHPILMLLTGAAVLSVTWNGVPLAHKAVADLILLAALAALTVCWFQGSVRIPIPGWLLAAAAALLAAQLVAQLFVPGGGSIGGSYTPPASPFWTLAKVELGMLLVPILIGAVASSWRRVNLIVTLWLVSATISAVIAIVDAVTGAGIGLTITKVQLAAAPRQAGLSLHPNHLGLASAMALPLALYRAAYTRGTGRAVGIAAAGLLLAGVLVSGSRTGLIAAGLAVVLTALLIVKLRSRIVFAGLAGVVVMLSIASFVPGANPLLVGLDRLGGGGSALLADAARSEQLKQSLDIALNHPATGVGFQTILDAHSVPVQFWEAGGILGVLAFILYITGVFGTGWRLLRDRRLPTGIPELAGVLTISFAAWPIGGLYTQMLGDRYIYIPVGLLLGLQLASATPRSELSPSEPALAPPPAEPQTPTPDSVEVERVPVAR